jgi:hypothetical protein
VNGSLGYKIQELECQRRELESGAGLRGRRHLPDDVRALETPVIRVPDALPHLRGAWPAEAGTARRGVMEQLPIRAPEPVTAIRHVPVDLATLQRVRDGLVRLP